MGLRVQRFVSRSLCPTVAERRRVNNKLAHRSDQKKGRQPVILEGTLSNAYLVLESAAIQDYGKRPFGRPRHIWDIRIALKEIGWEDEMDGACIAHGRDKK
jgi:hypothetical protein